MGKRSGAVGRGGDVALEIWAFDGENSHLNMLQGVQLCLGLPPLPSLDYFPLQSGAGAVWQLGEQVLPCSQENISMWVEKPASVGSCGWLSAACLLAGEESQPRASPLHCWGQALLSILWRNYAIISSSLTTQGFLPS